MSTLERAAEIAQEVHGHQVDKGGAPYIGHPLRVAGACLSEEAKMVAMLHDVVEDGAAQGWSFARLRDEGFNEAVLAALDSVTRRPDETYEAFVLRAAGNPLGREVKLADIADNMDLSRIPQPSAKDLERIEKYRRAQAVLLAATAQAGPPLP
ncbi:MAG: GTP pyrophosphokinase [Pseudomonadota bacterium]